MIGNAILNDIGRYRCQLHTCCASTDGQMFHTDVVQFMCGWCHVATSTRQSQRVHEIASCKWLLHTSIVHPWHLPQAALSKVAELSGGNSDVACKVYS